MNREVVKKVTRNNPKRESKSSGVGFSDTNTFTVMKESQRIEWKETWRDEYLRWICGFANAEGGILIIGKNDKGEFVGLTDARKLLQDIPNKVRDILGILVDVNLRGKAGREFLEIKIEPFPYPVSYKGEYHFRSGSTKQELKGAMLDRFLLRKQGRTWDGFPVPQVSTRTLSKTAIATFRALAKQSRRLDTDLLRGSASVLAEKLNLLDGHHLKRAAVLLFHPNPERFFAGAFIKIGYFLTDSELVYHDEIHGDLFSQAGKTIEVLLSKYLKAAIGYQGIQRVENLPVPEDALRESVLNAIIHRDYSIAAPIQIRVYADRLKIWNPGELPENWSVKKLLRQHPSRPFNPSIANAFFRAGEIEAWGRGIQRIYDACRETESPKPMIAYEPGELSMEFPFSPSYLKTIPPGSASRLGEKLGEKLGETRAAILQAMYLNPRVSAKALAADLGLSTTAIENQIRILKNEKFVRRLGPAKGGYWEVQI